MKYTAIVALMDGVLDSMGETLSTDAILPDDKTVKVTYGFHGPIIGTAELTKLDNTLVAEFSLIDEITNPASIEALHGVIGGMCKERKGPVISRYSVTEIGLTSTPADKRLPTLRRKL
jgi:hypothetical protein